MDKGMEKQEQEQNKNVKGKTEMKRGGGGRKISFNLNIYSTLKQYYVVRMKISKV